MFTIMAKRLLLVAPWRHHRNDMEVGTRFGPNPLERPGQIGRRRDPYKYRIGQTFHPARIGWTHPNPISFYPTYGRAGSPLQIIKKWLDSMREGLRWGSSSLRKRWSPAGSTGMGYVIQSKRWPMSGRKEREKPASTSSPSRTVRTSSNSATIQKPCDGVFGRSSVISDGKSVT